MMQIRCIAALLIFFLTGASCLAQKTISQKKVNSELQNIFKTKVYKSPDYEFVYETIDSLPAGHIFAGLSNQNRMYLDYINTNYTDIDREKLKSLNSDPQKRNREYVHQLQADPLFQKYFMELAYFYLQANGTTIKGYRPAPKMRITEDELAAIASKFFYATKTVDDGFAWKVCVGFNELRTNRKNTMEPLIEAFCFQTVVNNITDPESDSTGYYADFMRTAKQIAIDLKDDPEKENRLAKARLNMYAGMQQSDALKQALRQEYEKRKDMLSFVLEK